MTDRYHSMAIKSCDVRVAKKNSI